MTPPAISPDQATLAALATCVVVSLIVLAIAIAIGDLHPIRWIRARSAVIDLVLAWCHFEGYQVAGRIAAAARTASQWRRLQFGADQTPDWRVGELTGELPNVLTPDIDVATDDGDEDVNEQRTAEIARDAEEWCRQHGLLDPQPVDPAAVDEPIAGDEPKTADELPYWPHTWPLGGPVKKTAEPTATPSYLPRHRLGVVDGTDAQRARWAGPTAAYPAITTTHKPEGAAA